MGTRAYAVAVIIVTTILLAMVIVAESDGKERRIYGVKVIENCGKRAHPKQCRWRRHRLVRIEPHIRPFLEPVGACESTGGYDLRSGLRSYSSAGYYGRYQFGLPDWGRAGGHGDPRDASWLEQAYRAVEWKDINGRSSWPNC